VIRKAIPFAKRLKALTTYVPGECYAFMQMCRLKHVGLPTTPIEEANSPFVSGIGEYYELISE